MPFSVFNAAGAALNQSLTDTPVGSIQPFAGASAPSGWLLCDGAAVSRTDYAELFAVLGTTYGTGNGSTTFNVPDLRGRVPAGLDNMGGNAASRLTNTVLSASNTLGATGGAQTHTMTVSEMPSHTHTQNNFGVADTDAAGTNGFVRTQALVDDSAGGRGNANTGGGGAHNNTQPTLVVNYIILASSLATRLQAAALPQYVTSLPASPVDGQTVVYAADATNGVMWTLRYRAASSSSYKWEFVGGPKLAAQANGEVNTTSTSWVSLSGGPEVTAPLAGDYRVYTFMESFINSPANETTFMSYQVGGTAASEDNRIGKMNVSSAAMRGSVMGINFHTGVSASTTFSSRYRVGSTATAYFVYRRIAIEPVRVG